MAFTSARGVILMVMVASVLGVCMGNRDWRFGFNYTGWGWGWDSHYHPNRTQDAGPNKIIVGGSEHWHFGVNYTDWALKNAPFYFNDTLVFKYESPNKTFSHSVYLLPDLWSFMNCDLSRAKMIANTTQGRGGGFEFTLNSWRPYYFACGEANGIHCKQGLMKFFVMPVLRWQY